MRAWIQHYSWSYEKDLCLRYVFEIMCCGERERALCWFMVRLYKHKIERKEKDVFDLFTLYRAADFGYMQSPECSCRARERGTVYRMALQERRLWRSQGLPLLKIDV